MYLTGCPPGLPLLMRLAAQDCSVVVFMWLGPVLAAGWCYLLAALSYYVSRSPEETGRAACAKLLPFAVRCCGCMVTQKHADALHAHARSC